MQNLAALPKKSFRSKAKSKDATHQIRYEARYFYNGKWQRSDAINRTTITVYANDELVETIKAFAAAKGKSVSKAMLDAMLAVIEADNTESSGQVDDGC